MVAKFGTHNFSDRMDALPEAKKRTRILSDSLDARLQAKMGTHSF